MALFHEPKRFKGDLADNSAVIKLQIGKLHWSPGRLLVGGSEVGIGPCSLPDAQALQTLAGRDFEVRSKASAKLNNVILGVFLLAPLESKSGANLPE
jgi:hypothetical protein